MASSISRNEAEERPLAFPGVTERQGNNCESQKKDNFRYS